MDQQLNAFVKQHVGEREGVTCGLMDKIITCGFKIVVMELSWEFTKGSLKINCACDGLTEEGVFELVETP